MQFDFYIIEAGNGASFQIRLLNNARVEAVKENSKAAVNQKFLELASSNPDLLNMIVFSPDIGDPPGCIVAAELIHACPVVRKRQGKSVRELVWLTDPSTGLG